MCKYQVDIDLLRLQVSTWNLKIILDQPVSFLKTKFDKNVFLKNFFKKMLFRKIYGNNFFDDKRVNIVYGQDF